MTTGADPDAAALQGIAGDLLAATRAGRVTVRVDVPGPELFPVVAEACAPGVAPIRGDAAVDLRAAPTFVAVADQLRTVIQDDVLTAEPPTPREVVARYGVRAQMLAPLVRGSRCVGTLSVHQLDRPRAWSAADRQALDAAARAAADALRRP